MQQQDLYLLLDEDKLYQIIGFTQKPLCIENHQITSGARLVLGKKNQTTNNTLFSFKHIEHHYYRIRAFHSNLFLDVQGQNVDDRAALYQYAENTNTCQMFRFEYARDGWYIIRARHSSKVLDISDVKMESGALIHQFEMHSGNNQLFQVKAIE